MHAYIYLYLYAHMYVCVCMNACVCRWLTLFFFIYIFKTCHGPAEEVIGIWKPLPHIRNSKPNPLNPNTLCPARQPAQQQPGVSGLSFLWLCRFPLDGLGRAGQGRIPELCWCWSINVNDLLIIICKILCCRSPHTHTQAWTHSRAHLTVQLKRMSNVPCPFAW